ncbi:tellurite resistance TerB family protein [Profundibacter sp.]|uniref:tellurite resistance TerB family protein n=1 Tax=Profundibacter sp. TaxID=3101071 RepID=UPI003D0C7D01
MSLMKTLAKVAIGVAVAKGVGAMASKGRTSQASSGGGGLLDALTGGGGASQAQAGGGLQDMLGSLLGGGQQQAGPSAGGLGGLLEGLSDASQPHGGVKSSRGAASGGLNDLLAGMGGESGGLGGLLGGLTKGGGGDLGGLMGGAAATAAPKAKSTGKDKSANKQRSFGDKLNQSLLVGDEPDEAPTAEEEFAAGLMLKAMIQAAKSDGKIDDSEREKLLGQLGDISPQERDFVNAELAAPIDVNGLADQVPNGMEAQVYAMSVMGIDLDNRNEAQYLHDFATALGLDKRGVNNIHAQLGVPSIYG